VAAIEALAEDVRQERIKFRDYKAKKAEAEAELEACLAHAAGRSAEPKPASRSVPAAAATVISGLLGRENAIPPGKGEGKGKGKVNGNDLLRRGRMARIRAGIMAAMRDPDAVDAQMRAKEVVSGNRPIIAVDASTHPLPPSGSRCARVASQDLRPTVAASTSTLHATATDTRGPQMLTGLVGPALRRLERPCTVRARARRVSSSIEATKVIRPTRRKATPPPFRSYGDFYRSCLGNQGAGQGLIGVKGTAKRRPLKIPVRSSKRQRLHDSQVVASPSGKVDGALKVGGRLGALLSWTKRLFQ
jgi:hypothetical protein